MRNLKSKFLLLFLLLFTSCNVYAQNSTYSFAWHANSEPDMKSYKIWIWEGWDTTQVDFSQFTFFGEFSHDSLMALYPDSELVLDGVYTSPNDGKWMQIAGVAVDESQLESEVSYSEFFKKPDEVAPAKMIFRKIIKK